MMAGRPIDNERKACDAVARALEQLSGQTRTNPYSPEDRGAPAPVEYVFNLGQVQFALEHTIVEAFGGQIHTGVDFGSFIEPITKALDHHMPPPGRFDLLFSIDPSRGMKAREISAAQQAVISWVREKAGELHDECPLQPSRAQKPSGFRNERRATVAGVDLRLQRETHWAEPEAAHGRLFISRFAPKDYEALRTERMKKAMVKKLPKLKIWRDSGARSVLVLENGDLSLSNHVVILEAAEAALAGRTDGPDELWLVDTTIESEWTAWCLMRDGMSFPDDETKHRYWDFKPAGLDAV
ncbi:hypothetical protein [Bradyrhizobium japonicum]|uniref:hypothetical protein n=2 Tax=Bradyrhizobium japonicum TaxID=375 RepID=UPI0020A06C7F|nr:hypothetical protein [Bradyrhizobium japonicum]MCP1963321.1 hypothetical protein [Bradyrhizobium japonicum]